MNYGQPLTLHLLWLLLPALLLLYYADRRGLMLAVGGAYRGVRQRRLLKGGLFLAGTLFLVLALAGPRWGVREEVVERKGIDIVVALDLSRSMLTADIAPSRLERARLELASFIDSRRGDRVGIVAFAGRAVVACPLTTDYGAAKNFLKGLEVGSVPAGGTDLAGAVQVASGMLRGYKGREKVVVLLTDGEETLGDPVEAARKAAGEGISLYTLGFGTPEGGPIPLYDKEGRMTDYKKDREGRTIISRINAQLLKEMAGEGKGESFLGGGAVSALREALDRKEKSLISSTAFTRLEERFQYPLLLALLLLMASVALPERGRS